MWFRLISLSSNDKRHRCVSGDSMMGMAKWGFLSGLVIGGTVATLARKRCSPSSASRSDDPKEEPVSNGFSITLGNPVEQKAFVQEYAKFLIEWRRLQEVTKQVMLGRIINAPDITALVDLPDDDPRVIEAEDRYKADLSAFVLARTAVDDFSELLTLASNGYGTGAMKTLRGMYERVVTSTYVALFPEVSRALVESTWTHSWKVWKRATAIRPDLATAVDEKDVDALRQKAAEAQARHNESICKACKQLIQIHAWTKVDLATMAKKVDDRLTELNLEHVSLSDYYLRCYLQPTALEHATGTSVNEKFEYVDGHWTYKMNTSKERQQAMLFGHALLLLLLGRQNQHFGYALDDLIAPRIKAYGAVWTHVKPGQF
jgi:hypothetical protein